MLQEPSPSPGAFPARIDSIRKRAIARKEEGGGWFELAASLVNGPALPCGEIYLNLESRGVQHTSDSGFPTRRLAHTESRQTHTNRCWLKNFSPSRTKQGDVIA